jgi:hypothetical protein
MRRALLMPIAAAALAAAAIATWGPGLAGPEATATDARLLSAVGSGRAPVAVGSSTSRPRAIAAPRYRAEACTGDYICDVDGAWEPIAGAPAEAFTLTSDGF